MRPKLSRSQEIFQRCIKNPGRLSILNTSCLLLPQYQTVQTTACLCGTNTDGSIWVEVHGRGRFTIRPSVFDALLPGLKNHIRDSGGASDFSDDDLCCVQELGEL